ncbi:MAG: hypothetical protein HY318_06995, partial [Armatimonadetes bacterium]|nr:hypothetical protein [Armatimonadota bacterium]
MTSSRIHAFYLCQAILLISFSVHRTPSRCDAAASTPTSPQDFLDDTCEPNFSLRAALKPDPRSVPGAEAAVAFNWQTDSSGYLLTVSRRGARFSKVVKGRSKPLGGWSPWKTPAGDLLTITLQRRGKVIRAIVNGEVVTSALDEQFKDGKIATWSCRAEVSWQEVRYQPVQPVNLTDDFMRAEGEPDPWQTVRGTWGLHGVHGEPGVPPPGLTANPFSYRGLPDAEGKAIAVAGHWYWDGYSLCTAVKPEGKGAVGLCAYYQSPTDYLQFRWSYGLANGRKQFVLCSKGKEQVLGELPGGYEVNQWYWLEMRVANDRIEAFIDRQLALSLRSRSFGQGKAGLVVEGATTSAQFDDVVLCSVSPADPPALFPQSNAIPQHFVKDQYLREWATEEGAWDRSPGETFWHRGEFFSDPSVSLSLPPPTAEGAKIWTVIGSAEKSPDSGYRLEVGRPAADRLAWILYRNGAAVNKSETPSSILQEEKTLCFWKEGARVSARLGEEAVLTYRDPKPLLGGSVGYGLARWCVPPVKASARCSRLTDYTFSSAPVQWRTQRGSWDTEPHWACVGRGAHLMGMDVGSAVLWSKERYQGDLLLEAFVTNAQLPDHVSESPRNLNFTLCGDGVNLDKGYNFLFGGFDGKEVRILKDGQEVARCPYQTKRTGTHNQDVWFYVRVQKSGPTVSISIDGERIAHFLDPKPLRSGHLAVWTYATGIVLGRLRLWHDRTEPSKYPTDQVVSVERVVEMKNGKVMTALDAASSPSATEASLAQRKEDFEKGFGAFTTRDLPDAALLVLDSSTAARGRQSLKIINRACGGRFATWALSHPVDVTHSPLLSFDYRAPKDVKVNLYARVGGRWEEIGFTALSHPPEAAAAVGIPQPLGVIEKVVTDNRWHHASFNMLQALGRTPNSPTVVDGLAFASPDDFALRAGLSGNPLGATFYLDNFT